MKIMRYVILSLLFFIPTLSIADQGIGDVAQNLIEPVSVLSDFVATSSVVIGASFVMASFLRYLQYRINPLAMPISTVIMLLIMGILLILLPLAYKLTEGGIPYTYSMTL